MTAPQQINLEELDSWTDEDIEILKTVYPNLEEKEDAIELWACNTMVRIADCGDYEYAYEDFLLDHEDDPDQDGEVISYEDFVRELKKGYGKSQHLEISRLFELSNGIWYDNEYC